MGEGTLSNLLVFDITRQYKADPERFRSNKTIYDEDSGGEESEEAKGEAEVNTEATFWEKYRNPLRNVTKSCLKHHNNNCIYYA